MTQNRRTAHAPQLVDRLADGTGFHVGRVPTMQIDRQRIGEVTRRDAVVADYAKPVPTEVADNISEGAWVCWEC